MDMAEALRASARGLRGKLRLAESMSRHTSWRAGGCADRAYTPADLDDLRAFLAALDPREHVELVGLGSNLLVRDGGIRGTVVFTHGALARIAVQDGGLVYAEAGVASPKVSRFAATHGLEGGEFLAGIPGTVGGALAMNAGCYGAETWDRVERVLAVDRGGGLVERLPGDYRRGYRNCALLPPAAAGQEWFAAAWFRFIPGDGQAARERVKQFLSRRIASQPLGQPNAGSVFRNPPGDHAARLIEQCGLKGLRLGGAEVSRKHANFIVNTGSASALDIERLIETVRQTVMACRGVDLEPEVRIVGEPA